MKQYANAFRAGDPRFEDAELAVAWTEARRAALDLVLSAVASSQWADSLVLRGSVLLRAWFGEVAREPGDLDFVVVPQTWAIDDPATSAMLDGIAHAAEQAADRADGTVRFDAAGAVSDEIWTYDRVPGRRLVLPWTAGELPGGMVQLDFVFNEELPAPPAPTLVPAFSPSSGSTGATLLAATPELSLAWKLKWLVCDMYPQGKDLYDAMLLAEHRTITYELLGAAFTAGDLSETGAPPRLETVAELADHVDWEPFVAEHPALPGDMDEVFARLLRALGPTFTGLPTRDEPEYPLFVRWLAARIRAERELFAASDLASVHARMAEEGLPPVAAVVITRELLGSDHCDVAAARDRLYTHPAWSERLQGRRPHFHARLQERLDRL